MVCQRKPAHKEIAYFLYVIDDYLILTQVFTNHIRKGT